MHACDRGARSFSCVEVAVCGTGKREGKRRGGLEVDRQVLLWIHTRFEFSVFFSFWEVSCNRLVGMLCFFLPSEAIERANRFWRSDRTWNQSSTFMDVCFFSSGPRRLS